MKVVLFWLFHWLQGIFLPLTRLRHIRLSVVIVTLCCWQNAFSEAIPIPQGESFVYAGNNLGTAYFYSNADPNGKNTFRLDGNYNGFVGLNYLEKLDGEEHIVSFDVINTSRVIASIEIFGAEGNLISFVAVPSYDAAPTSILNGELPLYFAQDTYLRFAHAIEKFSFSVEGIPTYNKQKFTNLKVPKGGYIRISYVTDMALFYNIAVTAISVSEQITGAFLGESPSKYVAFRQLDGFFSTLIHSTAFQSMKQVLVSSNFDSLKQVTLPIIKGMIEYRLRGDKRLNATKYLNKLAVYMQIAEGVLTSLAEWTRWKQIQYFMADQDKLTIFIKVGSTGEKFYYYDIPSDDQQSYPLLDSGFNFISPASGVAIDTPLIMGNEYEIKWEYFGSSRVESVSLEYAKLESIVSNTSTFQSKPIVNTTKNSGSYRWKIPEGMEPGIYTIIIRSDNDLYADSGFFSIISPKCNFSDVKEGMYYTGGVRKLCELEVVEGYKGGTFGVAKPVTRAEFLKMAILAAADSSKKNSDFPQEKTSFSDVPESHWASGYIAWAKKNENNNIINGMSSQFFYPNEGINKATAAKIIAKAFNLSSVIGSKPLECPNFGDTEKGSWYCQYVAKLSEYGIMIGRKTGELSISDLLRLFYPVIDKTIIFEPAKKMTRAESATAICRAYSYKKQLDTALCD